MASPESIVQIIMDEANKVSAVVRGQVEAVVGDVTIDILSQNSGRFRRLREIKDFSFLTTSKSYKVPGDFYTASHHFYEIDDDENIVREIAIVSETRFVQRQTDDNYAGKLYAYIQTKQSDPLGPGEFLTLNGLPSTTGTYRMPYYRIPKAGDTDIIKNVVAIKEGVKSKLPKLFPESWQMNLVIYERMKKGIIEAPDTRTTDMQLMPSKRTRKKNRLMHGYGRNGSR